MAFGIGTRALTRQVYLDSQELGGWGGCLFKQAGLEVHILASQVIIFLLQELQSGKMEVNVIGNSGQDVAGTE